MKFFIYVCVVLSMLCAPYAVASDTCISDSSQALMNTKGFPLHHKTSSFPLIVYIDDSVPMNYRVAIQRAADTWNTLIGQEVFTFDITAREDFTIIPVISGDPANETALAYTKLRLIEVGTGRIASLMILVRSGLPYRIDTLERVLFHEFGHALGLAHDEHDPLSVMYPNITKSSLVVRNADIRYVRSQVLGCKNGNTKR